jgi:hypothetical protein
MIIIGFIIFWVVCSIITWGLSVNGWARRFPYMNNFKICLWLSIMGPISLISELISYDIIFPLKFQWKLYSYEKRFEIYKETYPLIATRENFDNCYR